MTRKPALVTIVSAVLAATGLTGCGVAGSQSASPASGSSGTLAPSTSPPASAEPSGESSAPDGRPTDFAAPDYHYGLTIGRFGPLGGVPLTVTVRSGKVTRVQFAADGEGGQRAGDDIPDLAQAEVTLNDVIAATRGVGDDTDPEVVWPKGQAYPDRVQVDPVENAIDDEFGYVVSEVVID